MVLAPSGVTRCVRWYEAPREAVAVRASLPAGWVHQGEFGVAELRHALLRGLLALIRFLGISATSALIVLGILSATHPWDAALQAHVAAPIDTDQQVIKRWETPDGTEVLPPQVMPLWQYIGEADDAQSRALRQFELAFERDLHKGDRSFSETHQLIDGR